METDIEKIVKAPHYFLVHFDEYFASVNGHRDNVGKPYAISCDGYTYNVYGFRSDKEAKAFDPLTLRGQLTGSRERTILWDAETLEELMEQINNDQRVKDGVFELRTFSPYGVIENLPTCQRMHVGEETGMLYCGKPVGEYGDGCFGGCVLQGYDQEKNMPDGPCPVHQYWDAQCAASREARV